MATQTKSKIKTNLDSNVKSEDILQAVIIGDSFNTRFAPITHFKPRVLLPLVNRPLLEYTLQMLKSAGIQETFIFSCAHSQQIKQFVLEWQRFSANNSMSVSVFASETFQSMGDAMRELDAKAIIKSDFILIFGDSIGNLPLQEIRAQHKKNRQLDKGCVMTTVFRRAKPNHRIRSVEDEFVIVVDSLTNKIFHFEKVMNNRKLQIPLNIFRENPSVTIHHDLHDTHLSICSINVPPLFTDNFDYETRDAFINGIIVHEELLGNSIYSHIVDSGYSARVINIAAYDRVSRDILQRYTHPTVPDMQNNCTYQRHNIYKKSGVHLAVDTKIQQNVAIGTGTAFGNKSFITDSTVGSHCRIGNNVIIEDSYIWNDVIIEDNCVLKKCIIADRVHLKPNVKINAGSIVSFDVILGPNIELKPFSRINFDPSVENENFDESIVGKEGKGYLYCEETDSSVEEEDLAQDIWGETDEENEDDDRFTNSTTFSDYSSDDERNISPPNDELKVFYDEVVDSLQRGIEEKVKCENLILEINSSKHAYNVPVRELNMLVIKAILDLPNNDNNYFNNLMLSFKHLLPLIRNYIKSIDSQNDCLYSIEEYCLSQDNRVTPSVFAKVAAHLYLNDVLLEEVINEWHKNAKPLAEFDFEEQTKLRSEKPVLGLIEWLETAEEEESESGESQ